SATSSWIIDRPRPSLRLMTDTAENSAAMITTKISSRQPARGSLALKKIFRRKKFAGGAGGIAWPEGAGVSGASLVILFSPPQHHGKLKRRCPAAAHFLCKHTACRRSSISRKKSLAAARGEHETYISNPAGDCPADVCNDWRQRRRYRTHDLQLRLCCGAPGAAAGFAAR